jgi:hypothetical protein
MDDPLFLKASRHANDIMVQVVTAATGMDGASASTMLHEMEPPTSIFMNQLADDLTKLYIVAANSARKVK